MFGFLAFGPSPLEEIDRTQVQVHASEEVAIEPSETVEQIKMKAIPTEPEKPAFDPQNKATWPTCAEGEIVRADNGQCAVPAVAPAPRVAVKTSTGSGDCATEINKYGWNKSVAHAVMMAESGGRTNSVNNNPATRDYSIGCFQVNLYGANARNRPSEAELKNAEINVRWAYNNYLANGSSFLGQWGVCRKIYCY